MDVKLFWEIIDNARNKAGRCEEMYKPLLKSISNMSIEDILL